MNRIVALAEANENGDLTDGEYAARIDVIQDRLALADTLKTEQKVKYSCYYIAVTDRNKTSLMATLSVMRGTLLSGSIEARILKGGQLAEFIALSKKLDVTDELTAPCETSFRLTSTVQDDKQLSHFVITGYPLKVPNAWGEELFDLPNTKVVMKLKPVEKSKALKRIDTAIMELSTQAKGKASKIIDKTTHVETLSALLARLQNEQRGAVRYDLYHYRIRQKKAKRTTNGSLGARSANSALRQTRCSGGRRTHILRSNLRHTTP